MTHDEMQPDDNDQQPKPRHEGGDVVIGFAGAIANGLRGAFLMAQGRADWHKTMDMSAHAVFRSFLAIPLAIPGQILAVESSRRLAIAEGQTVLPPVLLYVDRCLSSLIVWLFVVLFYGQVAKRIGAGWRISPVLIANNYATLLGYSLLGIGMGASYTFGAPSLLGWVFPIVMGLGLWLDWGMLRRALGVKPEAALVTILFIQIAAILVTIIAGVVLSGLLSVFVQGPS